MRKFVLILLLFVGTVVLGTSCEKEDIVLDTEAGCPNDGMSNCFPSEPRDPKDSE